MFVTKKGKISGMFIKSCYVLYSAYQPKRMEKKLIFPPVQPGLLLIFILLIVNSSFGQAKRPSCSCPKSVYSSYQSRYSVSIFKWQNDSFMWVSG